jgi:release factor glutamine methyltransferase
VTTINTRIADGRHRLQRSGIQHDEAALDARLLAQAVLGWDAARVLTAGNETEPSWFAARYEELLSRREKREPLPYITATREFWNLTFEVSPDVLIPRPETEGLVEALIEFFPDRHSSLRIADVCTGSGCVAIAVAFERPQAEVVAADASIPALQVARRNVERHQVADRVTCLQGDLLAPLTGTFDAIVANPPYVPLVSRDGLQPEVRDFEPGLALFGGADGLDLIRRLITESAPLLQKYGYLMLEFGDGQETAVRQLISDSDTLRMVDVKHDLQGIGRIAIAQPKA